MTFNHSNLDFAKLPQILSDVLEGEKNTMAIMATISCLLYHSLDEIIWAGFYIYEKQTNELVVDPYMGKMGCLRIQPNKGVCGSAFTQAKMLIVNNIDEFAGHISCDNASKSELVIPLFRDRKVYAVFDIDFDKYNVITNERVKVIEQVFKKFLNDKE